jgi:outer membrane protein assembly complex protein YaeT
MRVGAAAFLAKACAALLACAAPSAPLEENGVVFQGAEAFSRGELLDVVRNDLERYRADPRPSPLDDAAFRLIHHYQIAGYATVSVQFDVEDGRVVFRIREGPRYALGRVRFRGNDAFSDDELRAALPTPLLGGALPYTGATVEMLVAEVRAAYLERGHLDVFVDDPKLEVDPQEHRVDVTVRIREGPRYRFAGFVGVESHPELAEVLRKPAGEYYAASLPGRAEAAAADFFRERGHPFVRVGAEAKVDRGTASAAVALRIEPGPSARVAGVRIVGAERVREGFVRARADLEVGEPFRASDLREAEERLMRTGLFRTVHVSPGAFQEGTGDLVVDVALEEAPAGEAAFLAGYASLDGPRVGVEGSYRNLLGGSEFVRLAGTVSLLGFRGEAEAGVSYLLGTDLRPGVSAYYEDREFPSFEAISYGGAVSLSYPLLAELQATGGARYARIRTVEVDPKLPPEELLDFNYVAMFLQLTWDRRDHRVLPTRGFLLSGLGELSDKSFGSDVQFLRGSGRAVVLVPLPWDLVWATSLQGGVIAPIDGTDQIPIALRYFAGGTSTVRGFRADTLGPQADGEPLGGEAFLALQTELRFPIWRELHGAIFTDRGGVWFKRGEIDLDDTRYSVGAGLRYYTPAGAFVVDAAWNPHPEEDERPVEVHASIGFPF